MTRLFAAFLGAGAATLAFSLPAQAELRFCNDTDVNASIAIGYLGGEQWTSEGWWNAGSGECVTVVNGPQPQSYYYWHAVNEHGAFVSDDYYFCAVNDVFTIIGDQDCEARGHQRLSFNEIEIAASGTTEVRLTAALAPRPPAARKTPEPSAVEPAPQKTQESAALAVAKPEALAEPEPEPAPEPAPVSEPTPEPVLVPQPTLVLSVDIPVTELLTTTPLDFPGIKRALLGEWSQDESAGLTSEIGRDVFTDFKNGEATGGGTWRLAASCPGTPTQGPAVIATYEGAPEDDLCMIIDSLDEAAFSLRHPTRGDIVSYTR